MNGKKKKKKKFLIILQKKTDSLMLFAAIHQNNQFCIITRKANTETSEIHQREPLIINKKIKFQII